MLHISKEQARNFMLAHHDLLQFRHEATRDGLQALLKKLRCLQLDPLSPMGTSPDMVALARVKGYKMGDWFSQLLPGLAFEHYAKERCLLPADAFPYYCEHAVHTEWLRLREHLKRVPTEVLQAVHREIAERGPLTTSELSDRGPVKALDWSGWKGTAKLSTMAVEILWIQCRVVVAGRRKRDKVFDIPERVMPDTVGRPPSEFQRWALLERVEAAGLLNHGSGPHWSTIASSRRSGLPAKLAQEGLLEEVEIDGNPRRYWAPAGFLERPNDEADNHMRILGPLDPFMWDRSLIQHVFGFEYVWEVYKPAAKRRWGWYVCPLLHRGRLVGRIEGRARNGRLTIQNLWPEPGFRINRAALKATLKRHARACGLTDYSLP